MPQVDFYVLDTDAPRARWEFVARLLSKLQKLRTSAFIAVDAASEAEQLDALLWAFPPESFLPHCIEAATGESPREPFVISARPEAVASQDVYINLRQQAPAGHEQLARVVEVVVRESAILAATRRNFRFYREQGYSVQSHAIRAND